MAAKRASRRSKPYRVANPRGIPEGVRIAQLADGRELHVGDMVKADELPSETRQAWLSSGILEE